MYSGLSWLVTLLIPVAIVMTAVRLLLAPWFLTFEYNTPNFPPDRYGFTLEDRLHWAKLSLDYLVNDAGVEFWSSQRLLNGEPVYTERELSHFEDARRTLAAALQVWRLSLLLLVGLALWAWRGGWVAQYRRGLSRGGWLTLILLGSIILLIIVSFNQLFVMFHEIFFPQGNWMFNFSDTFIRLFPERFWRDIFIYIGAFSALAGTVLGFFARPR